MISEQIGYSAMYGHAIFARLQLSFSSGLMSAELPLLLREDNLLRFIFFRWFKLSVNVPVLVLVMVLVMVFECVVVFEECALQRQCSPTSPRTNHMRWIQVRVQDTVSVKYLCDNLFQEFSHSNVVHRKIVPYLKTSHHISKPCETLCPRKLSTFICRLEQLCERLFLG